MTLEPGEPCLRPVRLGELRGGSPWPAELHDRFAPVRGAAKAYSEEEINAAIDRAVTAVRK